MPTWQVLQASGLCQSSSQWEPCEFPTSQCTGEVLVLWYRGNFYLKFWTYTSSNKKTDGSIKYAIKAVSRVFWKLKMWKSFWCHLAPEVVNLSAFHFPNPAFLLLLFYLGNSSILHHRKEHSIWKTVFSHKNDYIYLGNHKTRCVLFCFIVFVFYLFSKNKKCFFIFAFKILCDGCYL